MEGLPQEDLHPFEFDDEDDLLPSGAPATHSTTSPRRPQKRPRSPTDAGRGSTHPSGQWAMDDEGDDGADEVSLSAADPRATAQGERTSPSWLVQVCQRLRVLVLLLLYVYRVRISCCLPGTWYDMVYGSVFLCLSYL